MFDAYIFNTKIVDTEGERDWAPVMFPETWSDNALTVALDG